MHHFIKSDDLLFERRKETDEYVYHVYIFSSEQIVNISC